jgi:hypothetical protein
MVIVAGSVAMLAQPVWALGARVEPVGGQSPVGSVASVTSLDEQMAYQRDVEATAWAMPAPGIYGVRNGFLTETPMKENVIAAFSARVMCVLRDT